ncbi:hypothetical protein VNI00_009835 [Paramarasmius palmivorus]|uniref:Uncharacterized protein n=1 Tax=Paramarasmius palmivorus TaxID=297713 RepID=A0AAW0CP73_9AGAR
MSENKSLSPTDPTLTPDLTPEIRSTRRAGVPTHHLAYIFTVTPAAQKFVKTENHLSELIPDPDDIEMSEWTELGTYDYKYNPFAYKGLPDDGSDCTYIFTGDRIQGNFIQRNTFFRFSDLEARLCSEPSKRHELFARDWLVALAFMKAEQRDWEHHTLPKGFELPSNENDLKNVQEYLQETKRHSHFPIWNTDGVLQTPWESAKFLATLFMRSDAINNANASSNVASFIFGRFCQLARAATLSQKSDWNVMARYWNVPMPQEIQFYYHPPDQIRLRMGNDIKGWEDIVKNGHEDTWDAMNKDKDQANNFLPNRKVVYTYNLGKTNQIYRKLGSHPQGLYTVLVSEPDWNTMQAGDNKIRPHEWAWPFHWKPTTTPKVPPYSENQELPIVQAWVTKEKIEVASIWGRSKGQNQVMEGASAPQIAKDIWPIERRDESQAAGEFEWLHRIAFSFGGMGREGGPDTAQVLRNLVFGTAETNTTMMRYEACVRRLACRDEIENVHVATELPHSGWGSWMVPVLRYAWKPTFRVEKKEKDQGKVNPSNIGDTGATDQLEVEGEANQLPKGDDKTRRKGKRRAVDFRLLGRGRPTTFEVMMDERVEKMIKEGSKLYDILYVYDASEKVNDVDEEIPWF